MNIKTIKIKKPEDVNFILGQAHFIKTVEDLYEAIKNTAPLMKFGIAFCEASGPALIRYDGNDDEMIELAKENALNLRCGHSFIIFIRDGFPINILNAIKNVPEVCGIFCASSNDAEVIVMENETGCGIIGVIDGIRSKGIEQEEDKIKRRDFLRKIGYKR
jgi:adenosine/AMP kinase